MNAEQLRHETIFKLYKFVCLRVTLSAYGVVLFDLGGGQQAQSHGYRSQKRQKFGFKTKSPDKFFERH